MQSRMDRAEAATKSVVEHKGNPGRGGSFRVYLLDYQQDACTVDKGELYGKMPGAQKYQGVGEVADIQASSTGP